MITMYPIFQLRQTMNDSGPNGQNWPFYAWASYDHPHAPGIMAQEIAEARYRTNHLFMFGVPLAAIFIAAILLLGLTATVPLYFAIFPAFIGLCISAIPSRDRFNELRGQMIESMIIADRPEKYGKTLDEMIAKNALQIERYPQFRQYGEAPEIEAMMRKPRVMAAARKWVDSHKALIERCEAAHRPAVKI